MQTLIPLAFLVGFPVMWCGVCLLLSYVGGWARLADIYQDDSGADGEVHYMRSGKVGIISYSSCLTLCVSDAGLRLSVMLPFRVGHPPLLIPWSDFQNVTQMRVMFLFPFINATIGDPIVATLALPRWVRDHIPAGASRQ